MDIWINCGTSDVPLGSSGAAFYELDSDVDYLILLTNGSASVADGQPLPTTTQKNNAGLPVTGVEQTCTKYFMADDSANLLRQIFNAGSGNKRYTFAFDFSESTASEPVLEAWDNTDYDSVDDVVLGAGTPSSSWIAGICTTDALPGVGWSGFRLAGDTAGHYLELNNGNGALSGAATLYCQLKIVMPATEVDGGNEQPVLVCKYAVV